MKRRGFLQSSSMLMGGAMLGAGLGTGLGAGLRPFPVAAQDKTPVRGGTLIWGHSETSHDLDIHKTGTASTLRVLQNVHNSIVSVDENYAVIPSLAESFEQSEDGLTYTFRLHPDVKFHDGKTVTSADVKYSFERCKNPDTGAVNFEVFNDVEAIETPDDLTVIVRMSQISAPLPVTPRRARRRRGAAGRLRRRAGHHADRLRPVQVRAARVRQRGRADPLRRLLAGRALSRRRAEPRGDRAQRPPDRPAHRRDASDQRHPARPHRRHEGRSGPAGADLVPDQLGVRQLQPCRPAVRRPARAPGARPDDRQGGAGAGRALGPGRGDRVAELSRPRRPTTPT